MKKWIVNNNNNDYIMHRGNDIINIHVNDYNYVWFGTIKGKEVNGVSKKTIGLDGLISLINNE